MQIYLSVKPLFKETAISYIYELQTYKSSHNNVSLSHSENIISFFEAVFPYIHCLAIMVANICILIGALVYLLDDREYTGKQMILRSFLTPIILTVVFSGNDSFFVMKSEYLEKIESFYNFALIYLLFILTAISIILLTASCGLYLIDSKSEYSKYMRKSIICLIAVFIPMGMKFPSIQNMW